MKNKTMTKKLFYFESVKKVYDLFIDLKISNINLNRAIQKKTKKKRKY